MITIQEAREKLLDIAQQFEELGKEVDELRFAYFDSINTVNIIELKSGEFTTKVELRGK